MRITLVSYNWPPRNAIGTHRPYSWAKHWTNAGVHVHVLTARKREFDAPLDLAMPRLDVLVDEVPYGPGSQPGADRGRANGVLKAVLKSANRIVASRLGIVIDPRDGWERAARGVATELARKSDVVISTYGPRSTHAIAAHMKRSNPGLVWVADYRDLWSQNHLAAYSNSARMREWQREMESVGASADLITTVSQELADTLRVSLGKRTEVIFNGFDRDDLSGVASLQTMDGPKSIVYTGLLYPGTRDPEPLFKALRSLIDAGTIALDTARVHFYGPEATWLPPLIEKYRLSSVVKLHGRVKRPEALGAQAGADLLLLLESGSPDAKGVLTGKLFEYLAVDRPILCVGSTPESAIGRMMTATGAGVCLGNNVEAIAAYLTSWVHGAAGSYKPRRDEIEKYSRQAQAMRLLELISAVVSERSPAIRSGVQ